MKSEEMQQPSKIFCDSVQLRYTPEVCMMTLDSGASSTEYVLTPQHTKRLLQYLTYTLEQYEKSYGVIDAPWTPRIISPMQKKHPPRTKS